MPYANIERRRQSSLENYYANKDKRRVVGNAWYAANRVEIAAHRKDKYASDAAYRAKAKARSRKQPQRVRPSRWKFLAKTPEMVLDQAARRRARVRGAMTAIPVDYAAVAARSAGVCGICGLVIEAGTSIHFDHIIPISRGGAHASENLQVAHARCNLRKGAKAA